MSARWIDGLELSAVDRSLMHVGSLDPSDDRSISVASPAALLVAKEFKISDRLDQSARRPDRLTDKDAGDVLRVMGTTPPREVEAIS